MSLDETTLFAFADGELPPAEAARIEAEAERDPALAARIDQVRALRRAVSAAYDEAMTEQPPSRLADAIAAGAKAGADVIDLASARARRTPANAWAAAARWGAMAASLALAFGVGRFFETPGPIAEGPGGLVARGPLAAGLERQLAATQSPDAPLKIGVSFQSRDGRYCRTFLMKGARPLAGLACRDPAGWQVRLAIAAEPQASTSGYATAAAAMPMPVLEAVDASIKGAPLDAAGEARAAKAGWR